MEAGGPGTGVAAAIIFPPSWRGVSSCASEQDEPGEGLGGRDGSSSAMAGGGPALWVSTGGGGGGTPRAVTIRTRPPFPLPPVPTAVGTSPAVTRGTAGEVADGGTI